MDVVIRAPRMGTLATRLRPAGGDAADMAAERAAKRHGADAAASSRRVEDERAALRREIEHAVRAELAAQAEALFETARKRGREQGRTEGRAEASARAHTEARAAQARRDERLHQALGALGRAQQDAERRLEATIGDIAFAAVCRLVGEALPTRAWIAGTVEAVCAELRGETQASVRLHPRDLALLDPQGRGELRLAGLELRLAPDDTLTPGGCALELRQGGLDATLETRLARLHATLTAAAPAAEG